MCFEIFFEINFAMNVMCVCVCENWKKTSENIQFLIASHWESHEPDPNESVYVCICVLKL